MSNTNVYDRLALDYYRAGLQLRVWCPKCKAFSRNAGMALCDKGHRQGHAP